MLQLIHPNLMNLLGLCKEEQPSWLVMEVMRGGSMNEQLTDPIGLIAKLEAFQNAFSAAVGVYGSLSGHKEEIARLKESNPPDMDEKIAMHEEKVRGFPSVEEIKRMWEEPLLQLRKYVAELYVPLDGDVIDQFADAYETYWNKRSTQTSYG